MFLGLGNYIFYCDFFFSNDFFSSIGGDTQTFVFDGALRGSHTRVCVSIQKPYIRAESQKKNRIESARYLASHIARLVHLLVSSIFRLNCNLQLFTSRQSHVLVNRW